MSSIDMYKENILENYKNPMNFGSIKNPTNKSTSFNKTCGDEITIELKISNKKIEDIKFNGKACTICTASASLLTEETKKLNLEKIKALKNEDVLELLEVPISAVRLKCALLPLEALQKAIKEKNEN